ncbi:MAG: hypothetical protein JO322_14640 [Candidatus Eremiobacteraeota bacterium]|nr:hypothetical protein [Candidatus Eremiobacteraeota bacterium]
MVGIILSAIVVAAAPSQTGMMQVPILFNDHHVNATPDELKRGRVLAALVKGGTVLVPLRSMFEQMGATVTYNPSNKSVRVSKAGSDVEVTVGVPEVTINGEKRPLDVPPEIYKGTLVVPVRVISEGMGAYVQWVPDRQIVVVRYLPPTPPPTAPPTAPPTPPPTAPPTPTPSPKPTAKNDIFIAGDYLFGGKVYNEFNAGNTSNGSWGARAAIEYASFMGSAEFQQYRYPHNCGGLTDPSCLVTTVGLTGQTFVPGFTARDDFSQVHVGYRLLPPSAYPIGRIYVGVAWEWNTYNQGYPTLSGFGFGAQKLPDLDKAISWYGEYYYYPNIRGTYTGFGQSLPMQYSLQMYNIGFVYSFSKGFPVFIEGGFNGNRGNAKANSPIGFTHNDFTAGLGFNLNP